MKKIIAFILTIATIASFTTSSFAEEYIVESMGEGYGQTEVLAHIYSNYTITIPATIDLSENNDCNVEVTNASLEDGYQIRVFCTNMESGGIQLFHKQDSSTSVMCELYSSEGEILNGDAPLLTFNQEEIDAGTNSKYFTLQLMQFGGKAGNYGGTAQYRFDCAMI